MYLENQFFFKSSVFVSKQCDITSVRVRLYRHARQYSRAKIRLLDEQKKRIVMFYTNIALVSELLLAGLACVNVALRIENYIYMFIF